MRPDEIQGRPRDYTEVVDQEISSDGAAGNSDSCAAASTFTIPADPGDADAMLRELGDLATATGWKLAAVVYALVRVQESPGRPRAEKASSDLLTAAQLAERGINGLRSKTTIRAYWRAWDKAITDGLAVPVSLGDEVQLPDTEWSDYYNVQTYSTPPFYRPSGAESLHDPTDMVDAGELGECPPMASDLDESELSVEGGQLDDASEAGGEDDASLAKWQTKVIARYLRSMKTKADYALGYMRSATEYDRQVVLEYVDTVRGILDSIAALVDGESFDDKLSRILDEGTDDER